MIWMKTNSLGIAQGKVDINSLGKLLPYLDSECIRLLSFLEIFEQ